MTQCCVNIKDDHVFNDMFITIWTYIDVGERMPIKLPQEHGRCKAHVAPLFLPIAFLKKQICKQHTLMHTKYLHLSKLVLTNMNMKFLLIQSQSMLNHIRMNT